MAKEFRIVLRYDTPKMPAGGVPGGLPTAAGANSLTGALKKLAPAIGGVVLAKKGFSDLIKHSEEMAQVGIMAGKTGEELRELGHDILDLSAKYGKSSSDMRTAAYNVYSAQVPATEALNVLEQSTRAAIAGNAEVSDSFNLISSVIKGYGKDWSEVGDVTDHVFKIIELGQTTMPELAGSMGSVVPIAKAMGVELDELSGFYATFTGVTGKADEVSTQLRATMTAFMKPTSAMQDHVKKLGYESAEALVKQEGLANALNIVAGATDGSAEAMAELFPQIRAMPLVMAATQAQSETLAEKIALIGERAGATDNAVEKVELSLAQRVARVKERFSATLTRLFELMVPLFEGGIALINGVFAVIEPLIKAFDSLPGYLQAIIVAVTALTAIQLKYNLAAVATEVILKAKAIAFKAATLGAKIYTMAVRVLTSSMGPLVIAVGGVIAIFAVWKASAEAARKSAVKALEAENQAASTTRENIDKQVEAIERLRDITAKTGKLTKDEEKEKAALIEEVAGILLMKESAVKKMTTAELEGQLRVYKGIQRRYEAERISAEQAAQTHEQRLAYLEEELEKLEINFERSEDIIKDIERAEMLLKNARDERAKAQQERNKEWIEAEEEARRKILEMDYEAGRISLDQYVSDLERRRDAIKGDSQQAILARMELQNRIDEINKEAFEKDIEIQEILTAEQVELAKRALDKIIENENSSYEERAAASQRYFQLREQQIRDQAAYEEWSEEQLDVALRAIARERADFEIEQDERVAKSSEEKEERRKAANKSAMEQIMANTQQMASSVISIYDGLLQREIDKIKARGLSEGEEREKIAQLEADYAKKKERVAKVEKAVKVSQSITNTAVAFTRALADPGGILGVILAGTIAAMGAAQTAAIIAQPYYKGGVIRKGQVGFIEGVRDEAVNIPMRGEGSFQEVARLELIPDILSDLRSGRVGGLGGGSSISGDRIIHTEIKEIYNGAVLTSDVNGINEWRRRGAAFYADKIIENERALEGKK